ncbi:DUF2149 domain-containing protein [Methanolobus sediminis]|uniref:DUF2149 domain-containing protein n=1 Tax=Methanolobus sediminis TaxID=3072978 RepID=A0AA51UK14_9EURY|nr:DUF2149 domain-containing protein [Methanolobus sediminis]WMW25013.1 DUF2149 domain-containing protein [Methanolobus sediminis]
MKGRRRYRRTGLINNEDEQNPLTGVANLFDIAMVFSVALLVALVMSYQMPELLNPTEDITLVKNPGQKDMQIIIKEEGKPLEVLNMTDQIGGGTGEALGTAYKLADGRVVYVPEDEEGGEEEVETATSD